MDVVKDHGDEELYNRLDSAYATEDEHSEVHALSDRYSRFSMFLF